ncbi:hypothetical protein ACFPU1_04125 [Thalassorhabdus alkalitolerans]|uniref:Uncharacterized protein n=1 Tax=Thalassorhabdus alkalitolerans TaxID=2282697 RepID=A0ABW0YI04_9BACI
MGLDKKWTNQKFEKELNTYLIGWKRIGDVVNGAHTVEVLCSRGHTRKLAPSKIKKQGQDCLECVRYLDRKNACEDFIKNLKKESYIPKFTFNNYKDSKTNLSVICPNGSPWKINRSGFVTERRRCRSLIIGREHIMR